MNADILRGLDIKGFLDQEEGIALYRLASLACRLGPCLEIGSYCGKTTAYLGLGCREAGGVLYAIDHHRGSEEQQAGAPYFDHELFDAKRRVVDTFPSFLANMTRLGLTDTVVPLVAPSLVVARKWATPLGLVLIDGGHSLEAAFGDYAAWSRHIVPGGYLAIHDIFPTIHEGGQAPRFIYTLALNSGLFSPLPQVKSLGLLQRLPLGEMGPLVREKWENNF
jgi:hypothetical protein